MASKTIAGAVRLIALPALSGALLFVAFPPIGVGWVAFLALVPLLCALPGLKGGGRAALAGLVTGLVLCLPGFAWVASVAVAGWVVLAFYVAAYAAVGAVGVRWLQRGFPRLWPALAACLWTGLELARAHFAAGFPWLFLGYTQHRFTALVQCASWGGVYSVTFLVFFVNASFAASLLRLRRPAGGATAAQRGALLPAVTALALLAAAALWGAAEARDLPLRPGPVVGVVQQSFPRLVSVIFDQTKSPQDYMRGYYAEREREVGVAVGLSESLAAEGAELIVWPESLAPVPLDVPGPLFRIAEERRLHDDVIGAAARIGGAAGCRFLVGAPAAFAAEASGSLLYTVQAQEQFGNSAVYLSERAEVLGRYDKMKLVPFGEYVPPYLRLFKGLTPIPRELTPGREAVVFELPQRRGPPVRFAALICYEDIFPALVRQFALRGAQFLVNVTDEGWYVAFPGELRQHLAMAAFRAVETRATVVRAANTGISCFINPLGQVYARLRPWQRGSLRARVMLCDVGTPYTRYGDWFAVACLMVALAAPPVLIALRGVRWR